jgi:hypothetical protein
MSESSNSAPSTACPFSADTLSREQSRFAIVIQRVENCLSSMTRINEQIQSLVEQRRKIQDELRGIQCQINDEFERILKPARPAATKVVARAVNGENGSGLKMDSRLPPEPADEIALARAAS